MFRASFLVVASIVVMCCRFASGSADNETQIVGCYDEPVTYAALVPEGTAIYQTFDAQLSAYILRVTLYMSWARGDIVKLSLCEGSDISTCANEQTVDAKPKSSYRPELTWTEFELYQRIYMIFGARYYLKWFVVKGSSVRFGITSPQNDCEWSWGYLQDGRSIIDIYPSPRIKYRLTVVQDGIPIYAHTSRRLLRGQRV